MQIKISRRHALTTAFTAAIAAITGKMVLSPDIVNAVTASYPNGIVSWTDVESGDPIQASHINQLYAEVKAIEDALLNGISHSLIIKS